MSDKNGRRFSADARIITTKNYVGGKLTEAKIKTINMRTSAPPATPKPSTHGNNSKSRK